MNFAALLTSPPLVRCMEQKGCSGFFEPSKNEGETEMYKRNRILGWVLCAVVAPVSR